MSRTVTAEQLATELSRSLRPDQIIVEGAELRTYECDGLTGHRATPLIAVLPETTAQVQAAVRLCSDHQLPFVARGSGTGLSGGAMPDAGGMLIVLTRMRRILEVDPANQRMVVEPGVTNLEISKVAAPHGLYYAPDPSSQVVCSIGGNVAENAGGAHCLKYGFTTHHVLGLEVVLPDASVVSFGGAVVETPGYDLRGVFIGTEGTLGIATRVTVRLLRLPEAVQTLVAEFDTPADAGAAVTAIIGEGIVPAAIELIDHLAVQACEAAVGAGFSLEAGAVLIVEVDGPRTECSQTFAAAKAACAVSGAIRVRVAADAAERKLIWQGRKAAFAAVGRLSPAFLIQDGVIPRTKLEPVLAQIAVLAAEAGLRVANVFHAGDGNLHPLVLYDAAKPGEAERAETVANRIVTLCVDVGGSITGEHGVGVDKACSMPAMFSEDDLAAMLRVRAAFDPERRCNPGKIFPTPRLCGERPGRYRPHPLEEAGVIDRW